MRLLYCKSCKKIIEVKKPPYPEKCPTCKKKLSYFGKENVTLTGKADEEKIPSVLSGKGQIYHNPQIEMQILECLDALKHQPENTHALYHLGTLFYTKNAVASARQTLERIFIMEPTHQEALELFIDITLAIDDIDPAIEKLKVLQTIDPDRADEIKATIAFLEQRQGPSKSPDSD